MTIHEIERRLRMPAHDEPVNLPPMLLPRDLPARDGFDATLGLRFGTPITVRLATAVLLLLGVLVGAIATGALRLEQLVTPFTPTGLYSARGIELAYPETWTRLTPPDPFGNSGASVALIVSSADVSGCGADDVGTLTPEPGVPTMGVDVQNEDQTGKIFGLEDRIHACVIEQRMAPGEVRITVTDTVPQAIATGPIGDFTDEFTGIPLAGFYDPPSVENGFPETIDGLPAKLVVQAASMVPGAEEVRTWAVARPGAIGSFLLVQATLAGPDLEASRAEADRIARSLRFSERPPELDEATRDAALATAIDSKDREMRFYPRSRLLGCMPRTPGEQQASVTEGPGGVLTEPVEVTCSTSVEATEIGLWRAELLVSWDDGHAVDAGRWGQVLYFDATGAVLGGGTIAGLAADGSEGDIFPGSAHPQPAAIEGPLVLPAGSLVRVLVPDLYAGIYNMELSDETSYLPTIGGSVGTYLYVLEGPVERDGLEWYLAAAEHEIGWMVPVADGRPLVEVVAQPDCPSMLDATELAYQQALVRRLCAGTGDITLGPVQAGRRDLGGFDQVTADPAWLAAEPEWELFGAGGSGGPDPGLPVALEPSLGETLPDDGWLTVTGHFDDPASVSCTRTLPSEWGQPPEPPQLQVLRCRDRFVVTAIDPAAAP